MDVQELKEKLCRGVSSSEGTDEILKVEKVLAPFMRTLKKRKHQKADFLPTVYEELYLKRNPKELLTQLKSAFTDVLKLKTLMNETAELLKVVTKSKSVNLYLTDYELGEIVLCPKYYAENPRFERRYPIESGTYVAAHVAFTKEYVISSDILGDMRFPQGIPEVPVVKSVICLPIITNVEENCIGIIELYRECSEKPYDLVNLQICNALTAWMGIALEENKAKLNLAKEIEVQQELSSLADLYFSGVIPFSTFVSDTVKMTKAAINAEKGAFYVFDKPVPFFSEDVLTADVYEEGVDDSEDAVLYKKNNRVRFFNSQPGIAGYAARTAEIINIRDAYKDYRFDRKSESFYYRTRSVLALPIKNENGVLAVLKLINCLDYPYFREEDIDVVQSFLCYISLICGYFLLDKEYSKTKLKLITTESLLEFHTKPLPEDMNEIKNFVRGDHQLPSDFFYFEWDLAHNEEEALKYIAYVFLCSDIFKPTFDVLNLSDFLLRVKTFYRPIFYHNFEHAFGVFHFTFNIILRNKHVYNTTEIVTALLAALCHDIDHTGFTNTFLSLTNDTIYELYGDFCGEAHRCELVLFLIQQTDLFANDSASTFHLISNNLRSLMMGFDLAIHFQNRNAITKLLNTDSFDWENPEHRLLSQNMILICSENFSSFKSFDLVKKSTSMFYKELHKQGDLEKSLGFSPLPLLDRNRIEMNPENQTILLSVVVLPVTEILIRLFPNLSALEESLRYVDPNVSVLFSFGEILIAFRNTWNGDRPDFANDVLLRASRQLSGNLALAYLNSIDYRTTLSKWNELLQSRELEMWKINEALPKDKRGAHKITLSHISPSSGRVFRKKLEE